MYVVPQNPLVWCERVSLVEPDFIQLLNRLQLQELENII